MEAAPRESGGVLGGVFVLGEGSGWLEWEGYLIG